MSRPPVVLVEYRPSEPLRLSVDERDSLRALVPGLTAEPEAGSTDTYVLTSGSTVGVVRAGDLTIELQPKIGVSPVLFLLSYALDARGWREPVAPLARAANLAEAIVPLFRDAVQAALRPGLLHGYRRHEDALTTVRGRVRMAEQMRARTGLPLPVEVVYDDFTPDILENQLLRSAVDVLGHLRLRHSDSRRSLARLNQVLQPASLLPMDRRNVPEPYWTRLNERYRPAVALARLILATVGLEAQAGREDASSFVIDMNAVFERFVREALREKLRLPRSAFPSGKVSSPVYLDAGRHVSLEPDLSWWEGGTCVFVGDCKYKKTTGSVPNADVYQMLAYLTALDLRSGLLVYAAGENEPSDTDIDIDAAGKRIHIRTLDVAKPPAAVLDGVTRIGELVQRLRLQACKEHSDSGRRGSGGALVR